VRRGATHPRSHHEAAPHRLLGAAAAHGVDQPCSQLGLGHPRADAGVELVEGLRGDLGCAPQADELFGVLDRSEPPEQLLGSGQIQAQAAEALIKIHRQPVGLEQQPPHPGFPQHGFQMRPGIPVGHLHQREVALVSRPQEVPIVGDQEALGCRDQQDGERPGEPGQILHAGTVGLFCAEQDEGVQPLPPEMLPEPCDPLHPRHAALL